MVLPRSAESHTSTHDSQPAEHGYYLRPVILVIDDDPGIHESFRVLLEDQYEVLGVLDGQTALKIVDVCKVDLVLLDLRLSSMDGMEILAQMKEIKPQMKVVVVTAVIDVRTAVEVIKLGAADYLTKPFSEVELLSLIQCLLASCTQDAFVLTQSDQTSRRRDVRGERVLFVGNAPGILVTLKIALERFCVADVAANTTAALWQLSRDPPALLIVHTSLPPPDCVRLLGVIRSSYPDVPVILMSSDDSTSLLSPELALLPRYAHIEDPHRFNTLLHEIAALLSVGRVPRGLPPSSSLYIAKAMSYISRHYAGALTVETMAKAIGISEGHLAHLFPAELRMTVKQFVTRVRIEVAKQLLYDRSYTLEHIAEMVGYSDASHLSRVFRQLAGRRPGDYRREITSA